MLGLIIATHHENLTITISTLALALSFVSLGWKIYRDIILKARLRVRFGVSQRIMPDGTVTAPFLQLAVVNLGLGDTRVVAARVRTRPFFLGWFRKESLSTAIDNFNDPFCAKLPATMAVGEKCTSPDKTDTEIWLTNAVCYRSECCTAFKVASRHKTAAPYGLPSIYSVCSLELRYAFCKQVAYT